jgi:hypothetical protein
MSIKFNPALHQKVRYTGSNEDLRRANLYVVVKADFKNFYLMEPDDEVVIHLYSKKFDELLYQSDPTTKKLYTVKMSDLQKEGDLWRKPV